MVRRILKFRAVNRDIFEALVSGRKKIETRAATLKYRKIRVGDIMILNCVREKVERRIASVENFKTIAALLKKYRPEDIHPDLHSASEAKKLYYSFPEYKEKIKDFGLVVWKLK